MGVRLTGEVLSATRAEALERERVVEAGTDALVEADGRPVGALVQVPLAVHALKAEPAGRTRGGQGPEGVRLMTAGAEQGHRTERN